MARKKTKYDPDKRDIFVIATAWLTSIGYVQDEIKEHLGISQGLVSQLIVEAKDRGFLAKYPAFYCNAKGLTEEKIAEAKNLCIADDPLTAQLKELQTRPVEFELAVFPSGRTEFARGAAYYVVELLTKSNLIGIGYGRTLEQLVQAIGDVTRGERQRFANHRCVPLSGSPTHLLNQREERYTSSVLSNELQKALTGKVLGDLPSLTGVPAYVARKFALEQGASSAKEQTKQTPHPKSADSSPTGFVRSVPGYQQIFGADVDSTSEPYVQRIDTFLTGLGIVAPQGDPSGPYTTGTFIRERIAAEQSKDVTVDTLRPIIHGDLGGILVPRKHVCADTAEWKLVEDLNRAWIGLRMHHVAKIATKAKKGGPPGVIVATIDHSRSESVIAERAAMIKEVVRQGLVNHLIISTDLADALRSDFRKRAYRAPRADRKKLKSKKCV
jgi:hypothetical protein